ncbi:MAG: hypothetical protein OXF29_01110 [Hyphomicrobiales bacterium]|nr:hypothetical protein [Hyphomicrobiales bacterium]
MKLFTYFLAIAMSTSLVTSAYAQDFDDKDCNDQFINNPAPTDRALEELEECEDKVDTENFQTTLYVLGGGLAVLLFYSFLRVANDDDSEASFMEMHSLLDKGIMPKVSYDPDTETTHFGWTIPLGE